MASMISRVALNCFSPVGGCPVGRGRGEGELGRVEEREALSSLFRMAALDFALASFGSRGEQCQEERGSLQPQEPPASFTRLD